MIMSVVMKQDFLRRSLVVRLLEKTCGFYLSEREKEAVNIQISIKEVELLVIFVAVNISCFVVSLAIDS